MEEALTAEEAQGSKMFKSLKHGAIFKWMELVQQDAPQARIDAQSDLITLFAATARKIEEIEAMESA
jgi:hypothetical protein